MACLNLSSNLFQVTYVTVYYFNISHFCYCLGPTLFKSRLCKSPFDIVTKGIDTRHYFSNTTDVLTRKRRYVNSTHCLYKIIVLQNTKQIKVCRKTSVFYG